MAPIVAAMWLFVTGVVMAQGGVSSILDIEAPDSVRGLLNEHLSIAAPAGGILDEGERLRIAREAKQQTADLLATEGYFSPSLEVDAASGNRLKLVVVPGPRAEISSVDLAFAGDIARSDEARDKRRAALHSAWSLTVGKPFRQADWDAAKQTVLQALLAEDYAAAAIADSRAEVDPASGTVKLSVRYDSGPPFTLGQLEVSGLDTYDQDLVQRYNKLRPGEPYSQERLLELQRALQNTPYFSSVVVDIDSSAEQPADVAAGTPREAGQPVQVPVRVRVAEARPKRLSFGTGFSSNNGPRGEITYRDADIFGRGWLLVTGIRADRIDQLGYADIHLPPTSRDYRDSFGVLAEQTDNQGLKTRRGAIGAVRTRIKGIIETKWALNYQVERREVDGADDSQSKALALNYTWTWRHVDNVLDPRHGQVVSAQVGGATRLLLSDQNFLRGYVRAQQYWTVFDRDVFTLRGEVGWTAAPSRTGVPEEFLYRAGGANSVRGYNYQSIGVDEGNATVGGRYLITLSAEYVRWFTEQWGGAVFYDAGNATDNPHVTPLLRGYGLGVRWRSPAGPLALDLGYGERDRKLRPSFSISIAF